MKRNRLPLWLVAGIAIVLLVVTDISIRTLLLLAVVFIVGRRVAPFARRRVTRVRRRAQKRSGPAAEVTKLKEENTRLAAERDALATALAQRDRN